TAWRKMGRAEDVENENALTGEHLSGLVKIKHAVAPGLELFIHLADWDLSSGVFSGLKIDPDTLVQKLDLDSRSIISSRTGLQEKTILSKKEKMKLRRERWLQKIESVKMAKKKQKAEAKRKATPVVGDMQPLLEALPELSYLTTGGRARKPLKRLALRELVCYFSFLREEEVARFQEVISDPQYRANPLVAISKHLSERLGQGGAGEAL
uniref:Family with sequence similarity 207, member A n=1 Tax=Zonotrichia albicollis TaxID=44394 RepID=A0A8D2MZD6_ZONAL